MSASQYYHEQGGYPQQPPQAYGQQQGYPPQQGYGQHQQPYYPPQGPPQPQQNMQYVQPKQKRGGGCLGPCIAVLCCCCVAEEGCEACADCGDCLEGCC